VLAYASANSWANGGWYWRFGNAADVEELFDLDRLRDETIDYQREFVHGAAFRSREKRILVAGDSHARDVSNGLHMALAERGYDVRRLGLDDICLQEINEDGKPLEDTSSEGPRGCPRQINAYRRSHKSKFADIVIYSAMLSPGTAQSLDKFVKLARKTSRNKAMQIVIMDRAVNFNTLHNQAIKRYADGVLPQDINAYAATVDKEALLLDAIKADFAKDPALDDVHVVSKRRYQCSEASCDFFANDGTLAIWDSSHWTLKGARTFMIRFTNDYPELFNQQDLN
jgi:hypothetical protein